MLNGLDVDPAALTGNRLPLAGLRAANELRVEADMPYSRTGSATLADLLDCLSRASGADLGEWAGRWGGTLSGYELTATVQGFWQADQAALLAGYVPRYFAALAEAAAGGAADLARIWCRHGFPHHAVAAATVRAGERCLETGGLTGSLRRLLADQLDDLRRAVAVRSKDQARAGGPRCA